VSSLSGESYSLDELLDFFSSLAAVYSIQDPIKALEDKIKKKAWFEGVILATALLESISVTKLRVYYQDKLDDLGKIDNLSFEKIAMFLFGLGIINQSTYSRMIIINQQKKELTKNIRLQYKLKPKEAENIIGKAIECFKAFGYRKKQTP
jgi:Zn-dependent peptidase ImmA (M78 family)